MAHAFHKAGKTTKTTRVSVDHKTLIKEICPECGYAAVHLHAGKKCPMCKPCPRCGKKVMHCECIEGE